MIRLWTPSRSTLINIDQATPRLGACIIEEPGLTRCMSPKFMVRLPKFYKHSVVEVGGAYRSQQKILAKSYQDLVKIW